MRSGFSVITLFFLKDVAMIAVSHYLLLDINSNIPIIPLLTFLLLILNWLIVAIAMAVD